jgi:transposase-like protein
VKDTNSFKIIMAQLYITGNATQAEINRVFGLNPINMKRWVKKYKENGLASFYIRKKTKKPHVMTEEIIKKAQELLNNGKSISETARDLDIKEDTLRKSIKKGIIHKMEKKRGTRK